MKTPAVNAAGTDHPNRRDGISVDIGSIDLDPAR